MRKWRKRDFHRYSSTGSSRSIQISPVLDLSSVQARLLAKVTTVVYKEEKFTQMLLAFILHSPMFSEIKLIAVANSSSPYRNSTENSIRLRLIRPVGPCLYKGYDPCSDPENSSCFPMWFPKSLSKWMMLIIEK